MLNKVQQLFIGNATGAANSVGVTTLVTDAASVSLGDVFLVNSALKVLAAASDVTPVIYVAQGTAAGKYKLSAPIQVGNITNAKIWGYTAPTQKVVALGNIGSGVLDLTTTNGKTYKASVLIKDDQRFMPQRQTRRDFAFTANFASTTPTTAEHIAFIQQFVDAINNDEFLSTLVVASLNNTANALGICITGLAQTFNKYNNRVEYVDFIGSFYDVTDSSSTYQATVTTVAAFNPGSGTASQIEALERKLWAWEGTTNKIQFPVIEPTLFTCATTNYSVINIDWFNETPGMLEGRDKKPEGVILALATGSAQLTAVETMIQLLNNSGSGEISNNVAFVDADV